MSPTLVLSLSTLADQYGRAFQLTFELNRAEGDESGLSVTVTSGNLTAKQVLWITSQMFRDFVGQLSGIQQGGVAEAQLDDYDDRGRIAIGCSEPHRPMLSFRLVTDGVDLSDAGRVTVEGNALPVDAEFVNRLRRFIADWLVHRS